MHAPGVSWRGASEPLDRFVASGKSSDIPTRGSGARAASALRARTISGAHIRSEVIRSLHPTLVGLHGPASSGDASWLAQGAKSQVNAILGELVSAGLVERTGTDRRRQYEPRILDDDATARSLWAGWSELRYAPWRPATAALAHLDQILMSTIEVGPRSSAVEAVVHYQAATPLLARIDPSLAVPMGGGNAREVLSQLRSQAMDAMRRVVGLLADGHDPHRGVLPAALRVPPASTTGTNPWRLMFRGGNLVG